MLPTFACGTIATLPFESSRWWTFFDTRRSWSGPDTEIPRVYGGVALDLEELGYPNESLALLDLPFSLVADTVLLPYTIYAQIRYGSLELRKANGAPPSPGPAGP